MARFDLLHMTDLHVAARSRRVGFPDNVAPLAKWLLRRVRQRPAAYPNPHWVSTYDPAIAEAAAEFAESNKGAYDAILITGDLAATGEAASLQVASDLVASPAGGSRRWCNADEKPTLQATGKPVLVLPGNHDRFGAPPQCYPGNAGFDSAFGTASGTLRPWNCGQGVQELWDTTRDGVTLAIVGADFTLHPLDHGIPQFGIPGRYGQGRVYTTAPGYQPPIDLIAELARITKDLRCRFATCLVVWAVHFDPDSADPKLQLLDSREFQLACERNRIPLVLCGHTHESKRYAHHDTQILICGTTAQYWVGKSKNRLHMVSIEWDGSDATSPTISADQYAYASTWPAGFQFEKTI